MKKLVLGDCKKIISLIAFLVLALCLISSCASASDASAADGKPEEGADAESESSLKIVIVDETPETSTESESSLKIVIVDETPETSTESEDSLKIVMVDETPETNEGSDAFSEVEEVRDIGSTEDVLPDKNKDSVKKASGNVLMSERDNAGDSVAYYQSDHSIFGMPIYKCNEIVEITFLDTLDNMPSSAWDVSENQDGSVMAWVEWKDRDSNKHEEYYELYIAGDGGVDANPDSFYLFGNYRNLVSINFNDCFYTGNVTDMSFMFSFCKQLETLDLSVFDTSQVTNMSCMFDSCQSLKNLNVSNFDASKVTDMRGMFAYCKTLETLDVSSFDTSQVTDMDDMFRNCEMLETLDVSSFDTSKVTDMSCMFGNCEMLETLDVSNFDTSKVTNMMEMFGNCEMLETLDVSNFDTSKVTNMMGMFGNCEMLETLDVSSFDTLQVTDMNGMFDCCERLEMLDVSGFDTSKVTNMDYMFCNCERLETLDVSGFDFSQVTSSDSMFYGLKNCEITQTADTNSIDESIPESEEVTESEKTASENEVPASGGKYLENVNLPIWDGSIAENYADGSGTSDDPYQISNGEELALMADDIGQGNNTKCCFVLTADIQLNDLTGWEEWLTAPPANEFYGIGRSSDAEKCFQGVFDGQGHTVYGMYSKTGLFACLEKEVTITNVNIDASVVNGDNKTAGGLVGEIDTRVVGSGLITIKNCSFNGLVSGNSAGGIAGSISMGRSIDISYCKNNGSINGKIAGGAVGEISCRNGSGETSEAELLYCENYGEITGRQMSGGVIGSIDVQGGSGVSVRVSSCRNTAEINGEDEIGGIVGDVQVGAGQYVSIGGCVNSGNGGVIDDWLINSEGTLSLNYCYYKNVSSAYNNSTIRPYSENITTTALEGLNEEGFRQLGIPICSDAEEAKDTDSCVYYNGKIYYEGYSYRLFQANEDGTQEKMIDRVAGELYSYENYLFFHSIETNEMILYDMDTDKRYVVEDNASGYEIIKVNDGNIYYYDYSSRSAIVERYSIRDGQKYSIDLGVQALGEFYSIIINMGDTYFAVGQVRMDDGDAHDDAYRFYTLDGKLFQTVQGEDYAEDAYMSFQDGQLVIYSEDTIWLYDPIADKITKQISYSGVSFDYIISMDEEYLHVFDYYSDQEYKISLEDGSVSEVQP